MFLELNFSLFVVKFKNLEFSAPLNNNFNCKQIISRLAVEALI